MAGEAIRFNASLSTAGFDSGAARLQQVAAQTSGKVSASFASMGARITAVIAPFVGLYAAINSVRNALDLGGRMNDLSKTTGETAGNLAILERAFQNAGVGGEKMGQAIASMSNFITDFASGSKTASATMDSLGLSMADLSGKTPIERMQVFMSAIAGIQDPALRTALAMDVFKKAGKEIVPLASDFSGELGNARAELGSLPRLLDENAASLDQLGDRLTNAVGNKLTELAVGLAAGAAGADNFAESLAKIDAAGMGERVGNALRAAFAAPLEVLQGVGEILISGVLKAGNALKAAIEYAVNVYYEMMMNEGFYSGLKTYLEAMFAKVGEGFVGGIIESMKSLFGLMDWNPLWRPFLDAARGQLDEIQSKVSEAGESASVWMEQGATQMQAAFNGAVKDSKYVYEDALGAADHYEAGLQHFENAKAAAEAIKESSAETAKNFGTGSAAITKALEEIRGFDMSGKKGEQKPAWQYSSKPEEPKTYDAPGGGSYRSPGASAGGGPYSSSAPSKNERVADLRGSAHQDRADQRASELAGNGMYRSSIRAQDRGQRAYDRAMESARTRDAASNYSFDNRKAGNAGEAFQDYRDKNGLDYRGNLENELKKQGKEYDKTRSEQENFKDMLADKSKTPEERKAEQEAQREKHAPPGGMGAPEDKSAESVLDRLDKIIKHMETRLPIRVLSAA